MSYFMSRMRELNRRGWFHMGFDECNNPYYVHTASDTMAIWIANDDNNRGLNDYFEIRMKDGTILGRCQLFDLP